ncbi:Actin-related protein 5 [Camelus dromedarius]|uniref:Actin-related protein 5 n=1 Tax=Camelus dromedarius TaxID=9838 RepID=A0A5N4CVH5_CAMDR|nr:Actin-related protein 5 [Camelus dromedarius]KAB1262844.1 Actin-related protein 5 [Camelus dromedarius]KAB1262845.1 Actin-related protein 5 [Camelus dromedarius]KAB1262846.1 Actin-related protein 5 [Camelus dromedarius]KAB1262848.1 Actin-related protein 5 [Camelus dromedarius]
MAVASAAAPAVNVFSFRDVRAAPDPVLEAGPVAHGPLPVPLVLDNGSFQARAGWACPGPDPGPEPRLQFRAVCARGRGGARGGAGPQVGNALGSLEPLRWMLRSPFDRNVPVNLELQELLLDYSFQHLGVSSQGCVDHPIVLTEAVCNPLYSRQMMSELLFECYGIPKVAYGIDSLFSFYHNKPKSLISSGLIISSGYQCTHILPVLEGRLDARNCKRINLGGSQAAVYLQRLLQLKYPGHLAAITLSRTEEILHEHSYIAEDYVEVLIVFPFPDFQNHAFEELQKWRCPDYYEDNVHKMQLPFSSKLLGSTLTSEEKQERRQQQLRRLQELNARRREEKLQLDQERLDRLLYVQELLEEGQMDQFHKALMELNMDSPEELQSYIQKLSSAVEQAKQKILQAEVNLEVDVVESKPETPDLEQLEPSLEDVENINDFEPLFSEETPEVEKPVATVQPVFNLAAYHQLFVGTERIRAPEIIFQPSLIGEEQAGVAETLQYVLDRYPKDVQELLVQNVFLTGGNMMYPGMKGRIEKELLEMRPFQSSFQVQLASNPVLDAWYGARDWALDHLDDEDVWITRKEYEEKGGGYLKEHCASNVYVPIRLPKQASRSSEAQASGKGSGASGGGASEQA